MPPRCTVALRERLDEAIRALPERDRFGVSQCWFLWGDEERLYWVQRRKSVLLILWVRGGAHGFDGLGKRLPAELHSLNGHGGISVHSSMTQT